MKKKKIHQITCIFYILLSFGVILRCLWGLEAYIYIMFMSSVDQCILIYGTRGIHLRLRATEQSSYLWYNPNLCHVYKYYNVYIMVYNDSNLIKLIN